MKAVLARFMIPGVTGGIVQEMAYNAAVGIYLHNESYFAGMALYNLLPENNTLGTGYGADRYNVSFQGGYLFDNRICRHEFKPLSRGPSAKMSLNSTCQEKSCLTIGSGPE